MNTQDKAKITDLIYFHEMTLPVITFENIKYIPAKPLTSLAGLTWRSAKTTLLNGANVVLYGTALLKTQSLSLQEHNIVSSEEVLCIRLDRSEMYLARINTDRMKAKGNIEAAKKLLEQQQEWAKVLHNYETHGIAIKGKSANTDLMQIMKMRQMAIGKEKQIFSKMLSEKLAELGYSADDGQGDLFG